MATMLLTVLVALALVTSVSAAQNPCSAFKRNVHIALLAADPGTFSGTSESRYYFANLQGQSVNATKSTTVCGSKTYGTILGQPALVVSTGIGAITAALCIAELLECREYISEVVYFGTSGFPLQIGGVLNADGKGANPSTKTLHMGDICVTPIAVNWDCQSIDWSPQCKSYPNVDYAIPYFGGPLATGLFGVCQFVDVNKGSFDLANEIIAVSKTTTFAKNVIPRKPVVLNYEAHLFGNLSAGTGVKYQPVTANTLPSVYGSPVCAEVDSTYFFSGVPYEIIARNFSAIAINSAMKTKRTQRDVFMTNAFEGIGVAQTIQQYNALSTTKEKLNYVSVRANSDFSHDPVKKTDKGWVTVDGVAKIYGDGYAYAIASGANLVLTWLQERCVKGIAAKTIKGTLAKTCTYDIRKFY